jgi:hypothetical protein
MTVARSLLNEFIEFDFLECRQKGAGTVLAWMRFICSERFPLRLALINGR